VLVRDVINRGTECMSGQTSFTHQEETTLHRHYLQNHPFRGLFEMFNHGRICGVLQCLQCCVAEFKVECRESVVSASAGSVVPSVLTYFQATYLEQEWNE
jgi:hypothetical protein